MIKIGFSLTSKALVKKWRYNNCILKPEKVISSKFFNSSLFFCSWSNWHNWDLRLVVVIFHVI